MNYLRRGGGLLSEQPPRSGTLNSDHNRVVTVTKNRHVTQLFGIYEYIGSEVQVHLWAGWLVVLVC